MNMGAMGGLGGMALPGGQQLGAMGSGLPGS